MSSSKINIGIIGKPNSGKSTLFNTLLGENISPVGDEYGLTKTLYKNKFNHKDHEFIIFDTPGLRRKSRISEKDELIRNLEVIKILKNVEIILLLIDSLEGITKQDFRLADLVINKNKIIFFIFNKIDTIDDKRKFRTQLKKFLKNNYSKHNLINIDFISAKNKFRIDNVLSEVVLKKKLLSIKIPKHKLNKYLDYLNKKDTFPKIKKREIRPKYIVQTNHKIPTFKIFINTQTKAPQIFERYFDNAFRSYFKLNGIPLIYDFQKSKNPYIR
tara:strand:+ start:470 stop:1285 length:816 start_codon:yes stop_codon:yes gene_type:complete